eukprot:gene1179-10693_t
MSCLKGNDPEKAKNDALNNNLKKQKNNMDTSVKVLLLGAGESGKSTFFKQMKIIYVNGYTQDELLAIRETVRENIMKSMKSLLSAANQRGFKLKPENEEAAEVISEFQLDENIDKKYTVKTGKCVAELWNDPAIQKVYEYRSEFQLFDSAVYFFSEIERISDFSYSPTIPDLIRCRTKTTGIVGIEFEIDKVHYKLSDVGGQRSERKKWIHCFDDVNAILFVVALSEYDLKCYEDGTTPRMDESLGLFEEICNNKHFTDTPIILFFNKDDLFRDKIEKTDLSVWDPDYTGGNDYDKAIKHIREKFLGVNPMSDRTIEVFVCTSTETSVVKQVFEQIKGAILQLRDSKKKK